VLFLDDGKTESMVYSSPAYTLDTLQIEPPTENSSNSDLINIPITKNLSNGQVTHYDRKHTLQTESQMENSPNGQLTNNPKPDTPYSLQTELQTEISLPIQLSNCPKTEPRENLQIESQNSPGGQLTNCLKIAVCNTSGSVYILRWKIGQNEVEKIGSLQLPKAVFSSPVWIDGEKVIVGCRDNYLYCFNTLNPT
jgi:hypothetical protein